MPFYVAAPISTLDLTLCFRRSDSDRAAAGDRGDARVRRAVAPDGTSVENPAFDVTPTRYVTAIITERGVARAPYTESLRAQMARTQSSSAE